MKAPVATSMRQGDHGPQARSNCKKISPQHAQTGKHEYFLKAEIHGRSKPWEYFTGDCVTFDASDDERNVTRSDRAQCSYLSLDPDRSARRMIRVRGAWCPARHPKVWEGADR